MFLKLAVLATAIEAGLTALVVGVSHLLDDYATRIALYVTALTLLGGALRWAWRNLAKPLAAILKRTLASVEVFEHLADWQKENDERWADVVAEVTKHRADISQVHNGQAAILRELGIEDKVRRMPPEAFGVPTDPVV